MNPFATTTSDVAPPITEFYVRTLLERADPHQVWGNFGDVKRMRKGHGNQIHLRRYHALSATPVELPEGVPPTGHRLNSTQITATVRYYADVVWITDELILESIDPVQAEAAEILGEQGGQMIDQVHRNVLNAGTNILMALDDFGNAAGARNLIAGRVNKVLLDKAKRTLGLAHARPITKAVNLSDKFGGKSLPPAFWCVTGSEVIYDLNNVPGYKYAHEYASQKDVLMEEDGAYGKMRFVESGQPMEWAGAGSTTVPTGISGTGTVVDVHSLVMFGAKSHATIKMDGMSMRYIAKQLGSSGTADPVDQIASAAWKAAAAAVITNENWMLRLEVAVSA